VLIFQSDFNGNERVSGGTLDTTYDSIDYVAEDNRSETSLALDNSDTGISTEAGSNLCPLASAENMAVDAMVASRVTDGDATHAGEVLDDDLSERSSLLLYCSVKNADSDVEERTDSDQQSFTYRRIEVRNDRHNNAENPLSDAPLLHSSQCDDRSLVLSVNGELTTFGKQTTDNGKQYSVHTVANCALPFSSVPEHAPETDDDKVQSNDSGNSLSLSADRPSRQLYDENSEVGSSSYALAEKTEPAFQMPTGSPLPVDLHIPFDEYASQISCDDSADMMVGPESQSYSQHVSNIDGDELPSVSPIAPDASDLDSSGLGTTMDTGNERSPSQNTKLVPSSTTISEDRLGQQEESDDSEVESDDYKLAAERGTEYQLPLGDPGRIQYYSESEHDEMPTLPIVSPRTTTDDDDDSVDTSLEVDGSGCCYVEELIVMKESDREKIECGVIEHLSSSDRLPQLADDSKDNSTYPNTWPVADADSDFQPTHGLQERSMRCDVLQITSDDVDIPSVQQRDRPDSDDTFSGSGAGDTDCGELFGGRHQYTSDSEDVDSSDSVEYTRHPGMEEPSDPPCPIEYIPRHADDNWGLPCDGDVSDIANENNENSDRLMVTLQLSLDDGTRDTVHVRRRNEPLSLL